MPLVTDLEELVTVLDRADRQVAGDIQLEPELENRIIAELEKCLVNRDRLKLYMSVLQRVLGDQMRYKEILGEDRLEDVLQCGLSMLKGRELVCLALNPLALWDIRDCIFVIYDKVSDHWAGLVLEDEFGAE